MPSVDDIRLRVAFRAHPKRQKLERRLGPGGVLALIDLWMWAGGSRPSGDLGGLSVEDIEIAAGWTGEPGAFVTALLDVRFLDQDQPDAPYQLHGWDEHQGWASHAELRSASAKKAAETRWRAHPCVSNADASRAELCERNAPSPSPSPSPKPTDQDRKKPRAVERATAPAAQSELNVGATAPAARAPVSPQSDAQRNADASERAEPLELTSSPQVLTREAAESLLGRASNGRYLAMGRKKRGTMELDQVRQRPDGGAVLERVGRMLAAGYEAWRGDFDGRHLHELPVWVQRAATWDGRSLRDVRAVANGVQGAAPVSHKYDGLTKVIDEE